MYNISKKGGDNMVGRKEEIQMLQETLNSSKAEFVAVYGRRRVGKTYLVKEFFNDTFSFYSTGVKNVNTRQQLRIFKEALEKYGDEIKSSPKDWFEAFSRLEKVLSSDKVKREYKTGKRIVFLDELPWMDTARSDFKSALDYFWNSWGASQKDLVLIVCGSATSWIINNVVKDTGGFYNRLTKQIHLMPFNLEECETLLKTNGMNLTRRQVVEGYMVFGGIPYYLNYLKPQYSMAQNIELLFFNENGPLRYEFDQLFKSLFKNADKYIEIIRELAHKNSGCTRAELMSNNRITGGKELTSCLEDLEQCGFIRKYHDYSKPNSGFHYQLIDSLSLFHLTFMEKQRICSWMDYINTPAYYAWSGIAFERVCLLHTKQIKKALGIAGISSYYYAWSSKKTSPGAQIDLLIDRKDDVINVCEIKYTLDEFEITASYEKEIIHKMETFQKETKSKKSLWPTMISFSGIKNNKHKNIIVNEITAEDLFK